MAVQRFVLASRRSKNGIVIWNVFVRTFEGRCLSHYNVGQEAASKILSTAFKTNENLRDLLTEAAL